ncbi:MAG: GTPase Era [Vicinamibacterales bacterium]|jgi:GTP-binding protein Era|nr:GTPase Era [Acidobacteriota bacterium]MDP7211749.1 GTPase Era [Vicinamibacterales bacterium]HJO18004.1 GTPase Era [Vicinamibacterales bacterium]|tara:strand:- start:24099 stop:24992 length:894 start_codon:yes stop_codon:yes gene_type:complete
MKAGFISLVGRPNAGKSSLLNKIIGAKLAIVSDKPQTTRNRIIGVKSYPSGQAVFMDTPGIHRPLHRMNVRMVEMALDSIRRVDVLGVIVDAAEMIGGGDRFILQQLRRVKSPVFLVLNKIDLIAKPKLLPMIDWYRQRYEFEEIVPVSALVGDGVPELESLLLKHLPDGDPIYPEDYLTNQPEKFFVAETVREKLLQHTHAEIPFSSAVVVDQFQEVDERGIIRLHCSIIVEQASQKPIVVGRGGSMVKTIGMEARKELESFFDTKVYLALHVKVRSDWRESDRLLNDLGMLSSGD